MRNLVLFVAAIGLLIWSLLCWAAYGLLGFAEGIAAGSAVFLPLPPELVVWMAGLLGGAGGVFVWIIWGLGAAAIAIVTMLLLALIPGRRDRASYYPVHSPQHPPRSEPFTPNRQVGSPGHRSAEEIVGRVLGKPTRR